VTKGYWVLPTLQQSHEFDALRDDDEFQALIAEATAGRERALAAFLEGGGRQLLGQT
jgi:hypothetical protein